MKLKYVYICTHAHLKSLIFSFSGSVRLFIFFLWQFRDDCCEFLAFLQHLAGLAIAEGCILGEFAAAHMHHVRLLVQGKLDWFEGGAHVRTVAERLVFWHAAAAPKVVLSTENRVFDFVRSNSRRGRKRVFTILWLKPSFKNLLAEFLNLNVWQTI